MTPHGPLDGWLNHVSSDGTGEWMTGVELHYGCSNELYSVALLRHFPGTAGCVYFGLLLPLRSERLSRH